VVKDYDYVGDKPLHSMMMFKDMVAKASARFRRHDRKTAWHLGNEATTKTAIVV